MTAEASDVLRRIERSTRWFALAALVLCAMLAFRSPLAAVQAYWFGLFAWFGVALGSLIIGLIHRTTGGQWGRALAPYLNAGVRLLPWLWLFALPLLFASFRDASLKAVAGDRSLALYLGHTGTIARAILYTVIFIFLRWFFLEKRPSWIGPVGLIVVVFSSHLLTIDWIFCFEPKWRSTAFPLVWLTSQALGGLAAAVGFSLLTGHRPEEKGTAGRPLGLDWGNLLLTATMLWAYVAFAQFLIIWAENLPDEASWYLHRRSPGWFTVGICLLVFHFLVPFFLLLSKRVKKTTRGLGFVAWFLLAGQLLDTAWTFLPSFSGSDFVATVLRLAALIAIGSVFINRYVFFARQYAVTA